MSKLKLLIDFINREPISKNGKFLEIDCAPYYDELEALETLRAQNNNLSQEIATLVLQRAELVEELELFCHRVDIGEVRSRKTYNQFKELLSKIKESGI